MTVCLRELTPDFKKCMENTAFFFLDTEKKRANGSQNARGKHSSNNVRVKGADQRESCLQFRPTRQVFHWLPGERAQREINLRYQFAEFCSIDGWVPRDFTLSAQEPGQQTKLLKDGYIFSLCFPSCLKETSSLSLLCQLCVSCECR